MTELHNLYETAMQILEKTIALGMTPEAVESTSVSAILTDRGNIYTGLNGSRLQNGVPSKTCSEYEAITAMMMSGENRIIGIVSIAFKNRQIVVPCDSCRELICRINPDNITCGIMTDENTALSLQMLLSGMTATNQQSNPQPAEEPQQPKPENGNVDWQTDGSFWGNDDDADSPLYQSDIKAPDENANQNKIPDILSSQNNGNNAADAPKIQNSVNNIPDAPENQESKNKVPDILSSQNNVNAAVEFNPQQNPFGSGFDDASDSAPPPPPIVMNNKYNNSHSVMNGGNNGMINENNNFNGANMISDVNNFNGANIINGGNNSGNANMMSDGNNFNGANIISDGNNFNGANIINGGNNSGSANIMSDGNNFNGANIINGGNNSGSANMMNDNNNFGGGMMMNGNFNNNGMVNANYNGGMMNNGGYYNSNMGGNVMMNNAYNSGMMNNNQPMNGNQYSNQPVMNNMNNGGMYNNYNANNQYSNQPVMNNGGMYNNYNSNNSSHYMNQQQFNNNNNYQQPTEQNPYDSVQPVPTSSLQRNAPASRYSNASGNIYVHSSIGSGNTAGVNSRNTSMNMVSPMNDSGGNSIYKQKLKDFLKTSTEVSEDTDSSDSKKEMSAVDKKAALKAAKESKKQAKKSFFNR